MRTLFGALALLLGSVAGAGAQDLQPGHSHSIDLGSLKGIAYYTVEAGGDYRLVVTVAQDETAVPVRFVALLSPNQKVTLSVPGDVGSQKTTLEIVREGDNIVISPQHLATN